MRYLLGTARNIFRGGAQIREPTTPTNHLDQSPAWRNDDNWQLISNTRLRLDERIQGTENQSIMLAKVDPLAPYRCPCWRFSKLLPGELDTDYIRVRNLFIFALKSIIYRGSTWRHMSWVNRACYVFCDCFIVLVHQSHSLWRLCDTFTLWKSIWQHWLVETCVIIFLSLHSAPTLLIDVLFAENCVRVVVRLYDLVQRKILWPDEFFNYRPALL